MESMFEMKVKEAIKPIEEICEKLTECTKAELAKGIENVDAKEMGEVVDAIKDLCEAKHYIVEAMYKTTIGTAMEENADDYGETWDEEGLKHYRRRDARGRFMYSPRTDYRMSPEMYRQYDPEYLREHDRQNGKMYYTEPFTVRNGSNPISMSRYENSRRNYTQSKVMKNGNSEAENTQNAQEAGKWIDSFAEDIKEMIPQMKQAEKNTVKTKLIGIANSL